MRGDVDDKKRGAWCVVVCDMRDGSRSLALSPPLITARVSTTRERLAATVDVAPRRATGASFREPMMAPPRAAELPPRAANVVWIA